MARAVLTERDDLRMELAIRITGTMLGDLIVGLGTLALAAFTYWLGKSARASGSQVAAQVRNLTTACRRPALSVNRRHADSPFIRKSPARRFPAFARNATIAKCRQLSFDNPRRGPLFV